MPGWSMQKIQKNLAWFYAVILLPKRIGGHILPPSLAPPFNKVSQVEIEAGDCEGRLPLLFESTHRRSSRLLIFTDEYVILDCYRSGH